MARTAVLAIKIIADATQAAKALQGAGDTSRFEKGMARANRAAKATLLGIGALGAVAIHAASDLQQAQGAVDSVFGKNAPKVHALAKGAADAVGLAQSEYSQLASVLGAQLNNLGVAQKDLVPTTDELITKGADLAATFGGTTAEAVEALSAAFRGETDPIEKYGISLKQADVNAYLAAQGQDKLTGQAKKSAETQARLALIQEQSAAATGQFARESNTAAGQQQRATANFKNAMAQLGTVALPIVAKLAEKLAGLFRFVGQNATAFQVLIGVMGGLAVAVIAVNAAYKTYQAMLVVITVAQKVFQAQLISTRLGLVALAIQEKVVAAATKVWTAVQAVFNAVMAANPVALVIIAIVALVAAIVIAYKKSETFRAIVQNVMRAAANAVRWVIDILKIVWQWLGPKLSAALHAVKAVFSVVFKAAAAYVRTYIAVISTLIRWLKAGLGAAFRVVQSIARGVFNAIKSVISSVIAVIQKVIQAVKGPLSAAFRAARSVIVAAVNAIKAPFEAVLGVIKAIISAIRNIRFPSPPSWVSKLGGIVGLSAPAPGAAGLYRAAPTLARGAVSTPTLRRGGMAQAVGAGVHITVNGALDPDAVARQIDHLLTGRARRNSGIVQRLRTAHA